MSATFTPFLESGSPATTGDAYIRVRVTDEPRRDGSLLVYLRDGTALVVNGHLLLPLDPGRDCPEQSDGGNIGGRHQILVQRSVVRSRCQRERAG
jgi:hypothetical protein